MYLPLSAAVAEKDVELDIYGHLEDAGEIEAQVAADELVGGVRCHGFVSDADSGMPHLEPILI